MVWDRTSTFGKRHVFHNSRFISEGRPHFTHRLLFFNYVIFLKWVAPFVLLFKLWTVYWKSWIYPPCCQNCQTDILFFLTSKTTLPLFPHDSNKRVLCMNRENDSYSTSSGSTLIMWRVSQWQCGYPRRPYYTWAIEQWPSTPLYSSLRKFWLPNFFIKFDSYLFPRVHWDEEVK